MTNKLSGLKSGVRLRNELGTIRKLLFANNWGIYDEFGDEPMETLQDLKDSECNIIDSKLVIRRDNKTNIYRIIDNES